ncbi:hypothetical protein A7U60_g8079 [Sanghuangporus baumii]|uniref:RRM domain-containing protein n=1 Tax=Sanghuangporus baumii TaxID=108892 RepID=A0A9Q5N539_SANBA|nr:hypothetical protein A7U60_g8079 [Sanghuangporus baumii]
MSSPRGGARSKHYHGGIKAKVTKSTVQPAPAWKAKNIPAESRDPGGKILLSNLPIDVSDEEVLDLMKKTVGPVNFRESLMVYNVKGAPRGMAVVAFTRSIDAWRARGKFHGKLIDGRRLIKVEVIVDRDSDSSPATNTQNTRVTSAPEKSKSLFDRLGPPSTGRPSLIERTASRASRRPAAPAPVTPALRKRTKKGPKRVKKNVADLDREMEEYAAAGLRGPKLESISMTF